MWSVMGQNSQQLIVAEVFERDTAYNSQLVLLRSVLVRFTARFFFLFIYIYIISFAVCS